MSDDEIRAHLLEFLNADYECDTFSELMACQGGFLLVLGSGRGLLFRAQDNDVGVQEVAPDDVNYAIEAANGQEQEDDVD